MERKESTRGLCRSCPQALPPAPGWRSSDQADVAANRQNTPARQGGTTEVRLACSTLQATAQLSSRAIAAAAHTDLPAMATKGKPGRRSVR